jgi:hypothetical protein
MHQLRVLKRRVMTLSVALVLHVLLAMMVAICALVMMRTYLPMLRMVQFCSAWSVHAQILDFQTQIMTAVSMQSALR